MELKVDDNTIYAYTGTRLFDPKQTNIVFIHGAGMDHSVWTLQSRYFAHHGQNVLAVDLPGHGRSDGEPLTSIQMLADWVARLLNALEIDKAALVGHSMGSLAALETAARYPERTRALALLGTAVPMPVGKPLLDAAEANDHAAFDMITIWGHSAMSQLGGNRVPGMWMTGSALRLLERSPPGVLYTDLKACNEYQDGLASAARVQCPSLLILGRRDMMTPPRAAKDLLASIPGARSVVLENCGHVMMSERPDETLDALRTLL